MARLIRPLRQQWPQLNNHHHFCRSNPSLQHLLTSSPSSSTVNCCKAAPQIVSFTASPFSSRRSVHTRTRARGPRFANAPRSSDVEEKEGETGSGSDSESDGKKSRNERKREARRAVRWGMELAAFSPPQIKRILRMAKLEREVYEGLMLVKRLGPDVKEGKRRQYNYIGKLLRDAEPELMDALIHATKDGDWSRLQEIPGFKAPVEVDDKVIEDEFEEEEEVSEEQIEMATRWFDGLITNDVDITKEVYAVRVVDFDRQELRKLVRKVHAVQERESDGDEESDEKKVAAAMASAKKSLTRFLRILAKQMPTDESNAIEFY